MGEQLGKQRELIAGIAVDSTSGTVLAVDPAGVPTSTALMHNDVRATAEAADCTEALGKPISPTFGLAKMLWLKRNGQVKPGGRFLHATDFINEWLCGKPVPTDFANAMKSGVCLLSLDWPEDMDGTGVLRSELPEVRAPGEQIGWLDPNLAERWGLRSGLPVFAGTTDSNAGFYASGASKPGEWSSTLGTTLAVKGIATDPVADDLGRIYNHRHPDLHWLPGGASNAGGEMLRRWFDTASFDDLNHQAAALGQTDHLVYPSVRRGERLPFADSNFEPFVIGDRDDRPGFYLGALEGLAFVERWTYEVLRELGTQVKPIIYATGGGTKSDAWLQIRADVMDCEIRVPARAESAMGSAILAARGGTGQTVAETSAKMVQIDRRITARKDAALRAYYDEKYAAFVAACKERTSACS
jgi:sugar (pentulose or hexulose) kinase